MSDIADTIDEATASIVLIVSRAIYQHGHVHAAPDHLADIARSITAIPAIAAGLTAIGIAETRLDFSITRGLDPNSPPDEWSANSLPPDSTDIVIGVGTTTAAAIADLAANIDRARAEA